MDAHLKTTWAALLSSPVEGGKSPGDTDTEEDVDGV